MEIEKKYLVSEVPENLEKYDVWEIEQCYLCTAPTIRIRKKNDDYILTYKCHRGDVQKGKKLCVSDEVEVPLNERAYNHLKKKADGKVIRKTRYRMPYQGHTIELDIFHGDYNGMMLAEVEFDSVEESENFYPPSWFGKDVSGDYHYSNSYLSNN